MSRYLERAERVIPGGVNSNVRFELPRAIFTKGKGCRLWDADGKEYIDYVLGQGPALLGHVPEGIVEAVSEACSRGTVLGRESALAVEAAELVVEVLKWPAAVRFASTGTEGVQAALRLARGWTGRQKVLRFEGHYHGWLDTIFLGSTDASEAPSMTGQSEAARADLVVVPWNDAGVLDKTFEQLGDQIAAVIMEPVMFNSGGIAPRPGYLEHLREQCDRHGSVLIFDEVITGFRIALGGAVERLGVVPDLAVYGKAMGSGWPVAAVAGSSEIMGLAAEGVVHLAGTFNGNAMSAAATLATLRRLQTDPPYERMRKIGTKLQEGLREVTAEASVPLRIQGMESVFHASFGNAGQIYDLRELLSLDRPGYAAFSKRLVEAGVWVSGRGTWFISDAHRERDVDITLERIVEVLNQG